MNKILVTSTSSDFITRQQSNHLVLSLSFFLSLSHCTCEDSQKKTVIGQSLTNLSNARPKAGKSIAVYLSRLNNMRVQLAGTEGAIPDKRSLYHSYLTAREEYQPMLDLIQKWPVGMATIASLSEAF